MSVSDDRQLVGEFAQLAQALGTAPDEPVRLEIATKGAVSLVDRCDHAGITIIERGGELTRLSSDSVARRAIELQDELGQGPCLDVLRERETLISPDLRREPRWPQWAPEVSQALGVGSMMSVLVYADKRCCGALSLYADQGRGFDADDLAVGEALADHLSVILAAEREIDQLGLALNNRVTIGRAEGILMERFGMDDGQAFDYLRRISSHSNRKLVQVADDIARTRELPTTN
jgi:GAF domain-containing protein